MSEAFNPGLLVSECAVLRRERLLPIEGEVLVRQGQSVGAADVVAQAVLRGGLVPVNVAASLGVGPEEVPGALVKPSGETVEEGELLACTKGLLGLFRTECRAPAAGRIVSVSAATGQVMLEGPPTEVRLAAYVAGTIEAVRPGRGAIVATTGTFIQGIFGIGGETHGPLMLAVSSPVEVLSDREIGPAARGKVVVGGALVTLGALRRAVQVGAAAVVTGGIHGQDLRAFMDEDMGAAVTGAETLGLTLVVTEGFGEIAMARRIFRLLGEKEGFEASVNGATQIRAGVVRPEIVIPAPAGERAIAPADAGPGGIAIGSTVRVIRTPHFGALGRVVALPPEPQVIETGSRVRVLVVALESGLSVVVPRSNVEVF